MVIKSDSTFPEDPGLGFYHQIQFSVLLRTLSREEVLLYIYIYIYIYIYNSSHELSTPAPR